MLGWCMIINTQHTWEANALDIPVDECPGQFETAVMPLLCSGVIVLGVSRNEVGH